MKPSAARAESSVVSLRETALRASALLPIRPGPNAAPALAGPVVRPRIFSRGHRPAIFIIFALLWPLVGPQAAWCQQGRLQSQEIYTGRNAYVPTGPRLTSAMVRDEIERCLPRNVIDNADNDAILWNVGYDFFRNFPRNQDTAQAIKDGFLSARGGTPEQRVTMRKAAIYWEKIHDYGITNVPVGQDPNTRDKTYYGDHSKFTTLPRRSPGSKHPGYANYDWPGRFINKREPYRGRPDNPYPGKYHPGVYPP